MVQYVVYLILGVCLALHMLAYQQGFMQLHVCVEKDQCVA